MTSCNNDLNGPICQFAPITMNARSEYQKRFEERQRTVEFYRRQDRLVSYSRGFFFFSTILVWWLGSEENLFSSFWAFVPLVLFGILVVLHEAVQQKKARYMAAVEFYRRGLERVDHQWPGKGDPGTEFLDNDHPYARDLDIFGTGSLYERICIARTHLGKQVLAEWLLNPSTPEIIAGRQSAVQELQNELDFREELSLAGHQYTAGENRKMLMAWAGKKPQSFATSVRVLALIFVLCSITAAFLWGLRVTGSTPFVIALAAQFVFSLHWKERVNAALEDIDTATEQLRLLAQVLVVFEGKQFQCSLLKDLHNMLDSGGAPPSERVKKLTNLLELLDWRRNHFFAPISGLLLWKTQLAFAVNHWKEQNSQLIPNWLIAVAELEALNSFACFAFEREDLSYPEIPKNGRALHAQGIGHPLIPEKQMVRNDLHLGDDVNLLIVSGSNMSGKSTLLRSAGMNTILALAGAPVCAEKMIVSPLSVGASLIIRDSLLAGISHFYAEILRLRQIMDLTNGLRPVLFLLDEILHGTNSSDRLAGSLAYVRGLMKKGAIGLITTHDLALARIADEFGDQAKNIHFVDHLENGKVVFDYRIYPGVVQKSNALELMRSIGLDV